MMAPKPKSLNFIEAASAPVVTVTAWQMLFDHGQVTAGQTVLNPRRRGQCWRLRCTAGEPSRSSCSCDRCCGRSGYVRSLGAETVMDYRTEKFEDSLTGVDVVLDTVGGDTQQRSLRVLKPGGILVSVVRHQFPRRHKKRYGVRGAYFYVDVTTARPNNITERFDSGRLLAHVGTVLPLKEVRIAHEMLGGAPHKRGKIVLSISA